MVLRPLAKLCLAAAAVLAIVSWRPKRESHLRSLQQELITGSTDADAFSLLGGGGLASLLGPNGVALGNGNSSSILTGNTSVAPSVENQTNTFGDTTGTMNLGGSASATGLGDNTTVIGAGGALATMNGAFNNTFLRGTLLFTNFTEEPKSTKKSKKSNKGTFTTSFLTIGNSTTNSLSNVGLLAGGGGFFNGQNDTSAGLASGNGAGTVGIGTDSGADNGLTLSQANTLASILGGGIGSVNASGIGDAFGLGGGGGLAGSSGQTTSSNIFSNVDVLDLVNAFQSIPLTSNISGP